MRSQVLWSEDIVTPTQPNPENSDLSNTVWSLAFKPDGTEIVVAIGDRVFVYDAANGSMLHNLRAHDPGKAVYAVAYSRDSKRFASGG
jgi:intraflagellar transport protein 122